MAEEPLWLHQQEALNFCLARRAAMLGMDMGTGKSRVAIEFIRRTESRKTLVLCPLAVTDVWPAQVERFGGGDLHCLSLGQGTVRDRQLAAQQAYENASRCAVGPLPLVLVVNYEAARVAPFAPWLARVPWDLVVLDESHRTKAPAGATARFCRNFIRTARRRLCLTGTPMPHSPLDIWAQACFLVPRLFGRYAEFKARYGVWGGYEQRQLLRLQNEAELTAKINSFVYQCRAEEVLDLPPVMHERRYCELGARAWKAYRYLDDRFDELARSPDATGAEALVKLLRLQQLTGGWLTLDSLGDDPPGFGSGSDEHVDCAKAHLLGDLLEDLRPTEPVVVFCRFTRDIEAIHAQTAALGRTSLELSGRRHELAAWQAGKAPVLATQIQAGSEGVDLTRARYCAFYSLGPSLGQYLQALKRLHRPGQNRPVYYAHLLARHTVDEEVYTALARREDVVESVLRSRSARSRPSVPQNQRTQMQGAR